MRPSQCIPPLLSARLRYSATKPPPEPPDSSLFQIIMVAPLNEGTPKPSASSYDERTFPYVRIRLPSSAIKKAGKGLPFPACHG